MTRPLGGSGLALTANVLGVGALFLPWSVRDGFGTAAVLGWGYQIVVGALLVVALAAAAGAPGAGDGVAALAGRGLGAVHGRAVRAYYALGVTAGQVVVALVAGGFLAQALRPSIGPEHAGAFSGWAAAGVLLISVALVRARRQAPVLPVFAVVVVLLVVASVLARQGDAGSVPEPGQGSGGLLGAAGRAAVLQFFVVVGWEAACRLAPRAGGPRGGLRLLGGVASVGVLYGGALLAAAGAHTDAVVPGLALPDLGGSAAGRAAALAMAVVATLFCARNVRTATGLTAGLVAELAEPRGAREPGRDHRPGTVGAVAVVLGALACAGVALVRSGWLGADDVLMVPNAMACAVFLTAAATCAVIADGRGRLPGALTVLALVPLVPFLGPAVLFPLGLLAGSFLLSSGHRRRQAVHSRDAT